MKAMKRFLIPVLSVLLLLMPLPVSAATEGDVYAALRDIGVPEAYVGQAAGMLAKGTSDGAGVYRSDGTYYPYSAMVAYIYANPDAILAYCNAQGNQKTGTTTTTTAKGGQTTTTKTNGTGQQGGSTTDGKTQTNASGQSSTSATTASGDASAADSSTTESNTTAEGETTLAGQTTGSDAETTDAETTTDTETTDTETETTQDETTTEETELSDETVREEKQHKHTVIIAGVLLAAAFGGVILMLRGMMPAKNKDSERD